MTTYMYTITFVHLQTTRAHHRSLEADTPLSFVWRHKRGLFCKSQTNNRTDFLFETIMEQMVPCLQEPGPWRACHTCGVRRTIVDWRGWIDINLSLAPLLLFVSLLWFLADISPPTWQHVTRTVILWSIFWSKRRRPKILCKAQPAVRMLFLHSK